MAVWKCNNCGNTINTAAPPDPCPSCGQHCEFLDVSCYTPECGGAGSNNVDGKIFVESGKGIK